MYHAAKLNPLKRFVSRVRRSSRRLLDPYALPFTRHRRATYTMIRHIDRQTGRPCTTPVLAGRTEAGFVIPLTRGVEAPWYLDTEGCDHFSIEWQGATYRVAAPRLIKDAEALSAFPLLLRWLLRLSQTRYYALAQPQQEQNLAS